MILAREARPRYMGRPVAYGERDELGLPWATPHSAWLVEAAFLTRPVDCLSITS